MTIAEVRSHDHVTDVERREKYRWLDQEFWVIHVTRAAWDDPETLSMLLDLNVSRDNGNELWVPVGEVFEGTRFRDEHRQATA